MPTNQLQEALLTAKEAFVAEFLARVPSYTGISQAQINDIVVTATEISAKFTVPHFLYNEHQNANLIGFHLKRPGPYNALPAAEHAAKAVLQQEFERQIGLLLGRLAWKK